MTVGLVARSCGGFRQSGGLMLYQAGHVRGSAARGRGVLRGAIGALALAMFLSSGPVSAQRQGNPLEATSSPEARQSAFGSIPLDQLDSQSRAKVDKVLSNVTLFRRLPVRVIECDPSLYLFLIRHPDVVANIWEVFGVSQLHVEQVAPGSFQAVDTIGTRGKLEILHASDDLHLAFGDGSYEGAMSVRPARGCFLLILKSGYLRDTEGRCYITSRMDCFLNVEPGATELVTKVLQPVVSKVIDMNFAQSVGFVGSLSRTAELNPRGIQRLSTRLKHVRPEVREELAALVARIGTPRDGRTDDAEPKLGMSQPKSSRR